MLKKNKIKIIISSVIILLPMLFGLIMWNDLPDSMTTHWGADGVADGTSGKAFAVFGIPVLMLIMNFICLLITACDNRSKNQSDKALGIVFWIMPAVSIFANGIMYRSVLGGELDLPFITLLLLGAMFIFIGNYLPKITPNRTLGIKLSWTLQNEENWNKTHRFGGKLWFCGGIVMVLCAFLPLKIAVYVMLGLTAAMIISPMIYSYCLYRAHKKQGVEYITAPRSKSEKIAVRVSAVIVAVLLVGIAVLMFTGNVTAECTETSLTVSATYLSDATVNYSEIDEIEYRTDFDIGVRTNGFGSAKLSLGMFENDELGSYTLYAYAGAEGYIIIKSDGNALVIGLRDAEDTRAVYDTVIQKTDKTDAE